MQPNIEFLSSWEKAHLDLQDSPHTWSCPNTSQGPRAGSNCISPNITIFIIIYSWLWIRPRAVSDPTNKNFTAPLVKLMNYDLHKYELWHRVCAVAHETPGPSSWLCGKAAEMNSKTGEATLLELFYTFAYRGWVAQEKIVNLFHSRCRYEEERQARSWLDWKKRLILPLRGKSMSIKKRISSLEKLQHKQPSKHQEENKKKLQKRTFTWSGEENERSKVLIWWRLWVTKLCGCGSGSCQIN